MRKAYPGAAGPLADATALEADQGGGTINSLPAQSASYKNLPSADA